MLNNSEMTLSDAVTLRIVGALLSRAVTEKFNFNLRHTEGEIADYLKALFLGEGAEKLYALFLKDGRVTKPYLLSEGSINSVSVTPRMLIDKASVTGASEIILAHNHPRGGASPSEDDVITTRKLSALFFHAGIVLAAHYVVAGRDIEPVIIEE